MSAFVVDDNTIHRAVAAIHMVWHHLGRPYTFGGVAVRGDDDLTALGQALVRMNVAAVEQRYEEREATPLYRHKWLVQDGPVPEGGVGLCLYYKAMQCLHYQCSEGDVPETPLYRALADTINIVGSRIVSGADFGAA